MVVENAVRPLMDLGLTELEAEVYSHLVVNSPATGYGVAKATGKPTANTYKALASLHEKGAVIFEGGANRLWRAVPAAELLDTLEERFRVLKEKAESGLSRLNPSPQDERIYHLRTPDQVLRKFRKLLAQAEEIVLLDLFPWAAANLKDDIEATAARGIQVAAKLYDPCDLGGVQVAVDPDGPRTLERWSATWANGVFDARECLLALLSRNGESVHQAIWSGSAYLSCVYHGGLAYEISYAAEHPSGGRGRTARLVSERGEGGRQSARDAPGFRILRRRIREADPPAGDFE